MAWLLHLHGIAAVVALYAGYRTRKAWMASVPDRHQAGLFGWTSALLACVAFLFASGLALYARYRAPSGVRDWLLSNSPQLHVTWFEWKEHLGFFALALCCGLWLAARKASGHGSRALAFPLLVALLVCLAVSSTVGAVLSFLVRSVA